MGALRDRDVNRLLSAITELHAEANPETLTERTIGAVQKAISADFISFDGFARLDKHTQELKRSLEPNFSMPKTELLHLSDSWYNYTFDLTPDEIMFADAYSHESPLWNEMLLKNSRNLIRVSDFVGLKDFQRTTIFNEVYRRSGSNFQMSLMLPLNPETEMSCGLGRRLSDFSDDDCLMLMLLAPHLAAAINNSRVFGALRTDKQHLETATEAGQNAVVILDENETIRFITDYAKRLLEKYFTEDKQGDSLLPESIERWLAQVGGFGRDGEFFMPPIFMTRGEEGELHIKLAHDSRIGERILLLEEKMRLSSASLEPLGLTRREAEVLFWTARGRTDSEIAVLCNISVRTVQKHHEQIFIKLGVENRTAAVLRALSVLGIMKKILF